MPPVGEHEKRPLARILAEALRHQGVQPVEAFAQVARLHRHEHLEAAGKTQHDGGRPQGLSNARSRAAASPICFSSASSTRAPPGNCNSKKDEALEGTGVCACSITASTQHTGLAGLAGALLPAWVRRRACAQDANV